MRIVFGLYTFKLNNHKLKKFQYFDHLYENIEIEVIQKCVQLFWIPIFPLKKRYYLKNKEEVKEIYSNIPFEVTKNKTPWYSYTGLLLVPLILIGVLAHSKYIHSQIIRSFNEKNQKKIELIKNSNINDYYSLSYIYTIDIEGIPNVMKVTKVKTDSIFFQIPINPNPSLFSLGILNKYFDSNPKSKYVWISKKVLIEACTFDDDKKIPIPQIIENVNFSVQEILRK